MPKDKLLAAVTLLLFVSGALFIGYFGYTILKSQVQTSCYTVESFQMNDNYMGDLIAKGQSLRVLKDYYKCHPFQVGDIVLYRISPQLPLIVKMVAAAPGDQFSVEATDQKNIWQLKVNGEYVSDNKGLYKISSNKQPFLLQNQLERKGVLLDHELILLSRLSPGVSDSGTLGVLDIQSVVGKIDLTP